jgi:hypothetical protein
VLLTSTTAFPPCSRIPNNVHRRSRTPEALHVCIQQTGNRVQSPPVDHDLAPSHRALLFGTQLSAACFVFAVL